ncbi:MAG: hypothetical protein KDC95_05120 [Planctomycetes bacterium]|nr:hypothetical protein [Planctomycetota bacterium]
MVHYARGMPHPSIHTCLVFAALLGGSQVVAQKKLHEYRSNVQRDLLGYSVAGLGDVDGDGADDFAFGNFYDSTVALDAGAVFIHSGRTGARIRTHYGDAAGDWVGHAVCSAGDFDRDGVPDVLVSAYGSDKAHRDGGLVRCYSGKTGAVLTEVTSDRVLEEFGIALRKLGDVDADGVTDWLVGARRTPSNAGAVVVVSAKTGKRLHEVPWAPAYPYYPFDSIDVVGDVDGDLAPDFVVGNPAEDTGPWAINEGSARLYSGRTGKLLLEVLGDWDNYALGSRVAGIGDVDKDGTPDFVVSHIQRQPRPQPTLMTIRALSSKTGKGLWSYRMTWETLSSLVQVEDMTGDGVPDVLFGITNSRINDWVGYVACLDGVTGRKLFSIDGPERTSSFGYSVASLGDVNRDGVHDFIVGMARWTPGGGVQVWSGTPTNVRGGYSFFGQPCRDSTGVLWSLSPQDSTVPHVRGGAIKVQASAPVVFVPPTVAVWILGTRNDSWGTIPLPTALQAPFLTGCSLSIAPLLTFATSVGNPKSISLTIPLPQSSSLIGLDVFIQNALYATWQSGTRTLSGLHMTDSVRATIGP